MYHQANDTLISSSAPPGANIILEIYSVFFQEEPNQKLARATYRSPFSAHVHTKSIAIIRFWYLAKYHSQPPLYHLLVYQEQSLFTKLTHTPAHSPYRLPLGFPMISFSTAQPQSHKLLRYPPIVPYFWSRKTPPNIAIAFLPCKSSLVA